MLSEKLGRGRYGMDLANAGFRLSHAGIGCGHQRIRFQGQLDCLMQAQSVLR